MKKKNILLSILLLIIMGFGINFAIVKADSGWDSDYDSSSSWDSGGSWDSDSSWDSSYSYSGGSYSSDDDGSFIFVVIIIVIVFIIYMRKLKNPNSNLSTSVTNNTMDNYNEYNEEEIKKILPSFNKDEFLTKAYDTFINVQNAWSDFNYDELKKYLSDELFTTYKGQLKTLGLKKQKNIMNSFVKDRIYISDFKEINGKYTLSVILRVSFYDYVVDKDEKVVRGNKNVKMNNIYELTFISSKVSSKKENKCPNCNAKLDDGPTSVCPYCKSKIVHDNYDWILSKKEMKGRY